MGKLTESSAISPYTRDKVGFDGNLQNGRVPGNMLLAKWGGDLNVSLALHHLQERYTHLSGFISLNTTAKTSTEPYWTFVLREEKRKESDGGKLAGLWG